MGHQASDQTLESRKPFGIITSCLTQQQNLWALNFPQWKSRNLLSPGEMMLCLWAIMDPTGNSFRAGYSLSVGSWGERRPKVGNIYPRLPSRWMTSRATMSRNPASETGVGLTWSLDLYISFYLPPNVRGPMLCT
jgi:hypothetical protein